MALTEIGLNNGTMLPENAAALVGAGVLSVLVFPFVAVSMDRPDERAREAVGLPEVDVDAQLEVFSSAAKNSRAVRVLVCCSPDSGIPLASRN